MKILIPRDAWPRAIPSSFSSDSGGFELDRRERVQRHGHHRPRRRQQLARARLHLDAVAAPSHRRDRRGQPRLVSGTAGDRLQQPAGARGQRHPSARVLGQRQAVAGERVPAKHAGGARLVQRAVGERLQLSPQHLAVLVVEVELVHPLGDREPVDPRQLIDRERRVVRVRQRPLDPVHELQPAAVGDRISLGDRPGAPLVAHVPGGHVGVARQLDGQAGAGDLGERVGLVPVHPAAAVLDLVAVPGCRPGAAAQPVAPLQQQHTATVPCRLTGGGDPGEPTADHDHIVHARSLVRE